MKFVLCKSCAEEIAVDIAKQSHGLCIDRYREKVLGELPKVTGSGPRASLGSSVGGSGKRDLEDVDGGSASEDFEATNEPDDSA